MNANKKRIRWGLLGSTGKMGSQVIRVFSESEEFQNGLELVFEDSGRNEKLVQDKIFEAQPEVLLDFSRPETLLPLSLALKKLKTRVLICSTGWTEAQKNVLSKNIGQRNLSFLPNSSSGIHTLIEAIKGASKGLKDLKSKFKIEIFEAHHIHKKDAPSGTALWLKDVLKESLGTHAMSIEIQSQREGEIVGIHKVIIELPDEKLIFSHEALDRRVFATGALQALIDFTR